MAAEENGQTALDERVIEDAELEKILEDRQVAKGAAGEARKKVEGLSAMADERIGPLNLSDGDVVRIGRFRLTHKHVAEAERAFTVPARDQTTIKLAPTQE